MTEIKKRRKNECENEETEIRIIPEWNEGGFHFEALRNQNAIEDFLQKFLGGFAGVVSERGFQEDSVREDGNGEEFNVIGDHVISSLHQRPGLCCPVKSLKSARADSHAASWVLPGRFHQIHQVVRNRFFHRHLPDLLLEGSDVLKRQYGFQSRFGVGGHGKNPSFLLTRRVTDGKTHQKSVHLALRQRKRSLKLNGILGRDDEKRVGQFSRQSVGRDAALPHGFQQRALGSGRRAINFVRQHDIRKNWPRDELPGGGFPFRSGSGHGASRNFRRKQVRRELNPAELRVDASCQSPREQRLSNSRNVFQQQMLPRQKRGQAKLNGPGFAEKNEFHLVLEASKHRKSLKIGKVLAKKAELMKELSKQDESIIVYSGRNCKRKPAWKRNKNRILRKVPQHSNVFSGVGRQFFESGGNESMMKTAFSPGSILFLLLVLMCAAANATHSNPLLLLAGIFCLPLLGNFVIPWFHLRKIDVWKSVPTAAFAQEEIPCEIELISHARCGLSCTAVHPFPKVRTLFRLERVQEFAPQKRETHRVLSYSLKFHSRGIYDVSRLQISSSYPFGFFTWVKTFQTDVPPVTIFPARVETRDFWNQLEFPASPSGLRTAEGDFAGLRLWTEGDSLRKIHWRASARHGQLLVSKTDVPQPLSVFLIADLTDSDSRNAERRISQTASLVYEMCRNLTPFTLGASAAIWLKIVEKNQILLLKSGETDDFCQQALTILAQVQRRDPTLPRVDSSADVCAFQNEFPAPNVLWIGGNEND